MGGERNTDADSDRDDDNDYTITDLLETAGIQIYREESVIINMLDNE